MRGIMEMTGREGSSGKESKDRRGDCGVEVLVREELGGSSS